MKDKAVDFLLYMFMFGWIGIAVKLFFNNFILFCLYLMLTALIGLSQAYKEENKKSDSP